MSDGKLFSSIYYGGVKETELLLYRFVGVVLLEVSSFRLVIQVYHLK